MGVYHYTIKVDTTKKGGPNAKADNAIIRHSGKERKTEG
jgi:hypothetical protein